MKKTLGIRLYIILAAGLVLAHKGLWAAEDQSGNAAAPPPRIPYSDNAPLYPSPPRPALPPEMRGDIFMARKDYPKAVDFYSRAIRQTGQGNAVLWNKLGIALQQEDNFRGAEKAYRRSVRLQRDFAAAWNNLGTTYYLTNRYGKSIKLYKRAVKLDSKAASFHLNLGTAYYHKHKYELAVGEYRAALVLDPNILLENSSSGSIVQARTADVGYYFYMAKVFASLGRNQEAIRYLRHAFEDGFKDFRRLDRDPDFIKVRNDPAYISLRQHPPKAITD